MRIVFCTTLVACSLAVPLATASAQSSAASAAVTLLSVGASVALAADPVARASADDASRAAIRLMEQAGRLVIVSVHVGAELATIMLRDTLHFTVVSLTMPARVLDGSVAHHGAQVRVVRTAAGLALERDGRFLAFVPYPDCKHLVHSHAIVR